MNKRVGIIGAGPSGLALLSAWKAAEDKGEKLPKIDVYEKTAEIGGQWNF